MRIGAGPAQNLDWLYQIRSGRAFGNGTDLTASVGNLNEIQLLNPVGSTITGIVYAINGARTTAGAIQIRRHNTALTTAFQAGINLRLGDTAGQLVLRTDQVAAADGTRFNIRAAPALTTIPLAPLWSFTLDAGEGILVMSNDANVPLFADFYWIEF